jgi:hypothetical protein
VCVCVEWVLADAGGLVLSQSRYVSAPAKSDVSIRIKKIDSILSLVIRVVKM